MTRIAVIVGSTRPGRRAEMVAEWVAEAAAERTDVVVELVDLADFALPLLDEPVPALFGAYRHEHTLRWAKTIASYDGFVFVTPEYNHSYPAVVKNAIDYLFAEWTNKAAGFVSYGTTGGTRAVEHLRLTLAEVKVAGVRSQVALGLFTDFVITDPAERGVFAPGEQQRQTLDTMLDEVVAWSRAFKSLREPIAA